MDSATRNLIEEAKKTFGIYPCNYISLSRYFEEVTDRVIDKSDIFLVEKFQDILNWNILSSRFPFSESDIEFFSERLNWKELSYRTRFLSERIIDKYQKKLDWDGVTSFQKLSSEFIFSHLHRISYGRLFQDQIVSSELLDSLLSYNFPEKLDWRSISKNVILTREQLRKYKDHLDWQYISLYQPIISNDDVFLEFKDLVWDDSRFYRYNPFCNYKREMRGLVNKEWFICHSIIGDWFNIENSYCISYRNVGRVYIFRTRVFYKDLMSTVTFSNCDILKKINIEIDNIYKR